jgi:hypothetical protein
MFNIRFLIVALVVCGAVLNGCKKDPPPNNTTRSSALTSFPLAVGNAWKYHTVYTQVLSGDTAVLQFDSFWKVSNDTMINNELVSIMMQIDSNYNGSVDTGYSYYANRSNGLFGIAAIGSGSSFFLRTDEDATGMPAIGPSLISLRMDSVFIPGSSLWLLKFPSAENDLWASNEYGIADIFKRRWLSDTTVITPAGTFDCKMLQPMFDSDNNGQADSTAMKILQYFADEGLIKEERSGTIVPSSSGSGGTIHQITELVHQNF